MSVNWTIRAQRRLRGALAEGLCRESRDGAAATNLRGCSGLWEAAVDRLNDILASTFAGASVVVQDQLFGYRRHVDQDVLLVEVFGTDGAGRTGPYVVKIGSPARLEREQRGWDACRPSGLVHDLVFLSLHDPKVRTADGAWMSLVYGDAQQYLGVETTASFETAALDAVRAGVPTVPSVGFVIVELFERIGHLLYSQSFVDDPARPGFVFELPRLDDALARWESEPVDQAARREVNTLAASGTGQFLDPVDYLRYVQRFVPWGRNAATEPVSEVPGLPRPKVTELIPRMLRGWAHGDLHGRNVLVGIVHDRALWPTVFDYEEMSPCNLPGWDFVKLETELKVRAFLDVFAGLSPQRFVAEVQRFEIALNEATEDCHRNRSWPLVDLPSTTQGRLRALLLELRRMAAQHLGANHGRPNDWLEEYYFSLACYGVAAGRFPNLTMKERISAFLSAGVATARLTWPRVCWEVRILS